MIQRHLLLALLAIQGPAAAGTGDAKLDETQIRQHFERSLAHAGETLRIREERRKEFLDLGRIGGLGGGKDSCLAYLGETGDCAISASEFDSGLLACVPESLELHSRESLALRARNARRTVLEHLVDRAFLEAYRPDGSRRLPDTEARDLRTEIRAFPDDYAVTTWLRAFPRIRAQVVAASDSAWLAARSGDPRSGILPATLPAWQLPDSAAALLVRLPRGEWTPILRAPFGFLACSRLDSLPAPEALAKIRARLKPSASETGIAPRARAAESPDDHPGDCRDEDTLDVSLRLSPPLRRETQDPGPSWSTAPSTALPASLRSRLWAAYRQSPPDTLGPIRSEYGVWTVVPSAPRIKPGRTLDPTACLARIKTKSKIEGDAGRIRAEWETLDSKKHADATGEVRTALLESLSNQSARPESAYHKLRQDWAARSLRFTRDLGFLEAPPETGSRKGD